MTYLYNNLINIFKDPMTLLVDFQVVYKQKLCVRLTSLFPGWPIRYPFVSWNNLHTGTSDK